MGCVPLLPKEWLYYVLLASRFNGRREQPAGQACPSGLIGNDVTHCVANPFFASILFAIQIFVGYSKFAMD